LSNKILFGSLLKITKVLAFLPQTIRYRIHDTINEKYRDLQNHINKSTKYIIYGDPNMDSEHSYHKFSHCTNIADFANVTIIQYKNLNLKQMRDNGELYTIINNAITL